MNALTPTAPRLQTRKLNLGATPAPDIDAIDNVIKDYSEQNDVPRNTRPSEEKAIAAAAVAAATETANVTPLRKPRKANPAPTARWTIEAPAYLLAEIKQKMLKEGATQRYLTLKAFKDAGFTVHEIDLFKDGRREN